MQKQQQKNKVDINVDKEWLFFILSLIFKFNGIKLP